MLIGFNEGLNLTGSRKKEEEGVGSRSEGGIFTLLDCMRMQLNATHAKLSLHTKGATQSLWKR